MRLPIVMLLPFLLHACGFVRYMGTKEPCEKTEPEIEAYLHEHKISNFDYSLCLNDQLTDSLSAATYALDTWKLERHTPQSKMQIRIYDSVGRFLNGYAQCYGDFKRLNILKEKDFVYFRHLPNNTSLSFSNECDLWKVDTGVRSEIARLAAARTYTIIVYWNVWSNYYSTVMLREVQKYRKRFDPAGTKTVIILVNTDREI
jgi:hypothetical protein